MASRLSSKIGRTTKNGKIDLHKLYLKKIGEFCKELEIDKPF
jgi:hypothetical protein